MKNLLLITTILSLFSFSSFAEETDVTAPGADRCAEEGGKTPGNVESSSTEDSSGTKAKTE